MTRLLYGAILAALAAGCTGSGVDAEPMPPPDHAALAALRADGRALFFGRAGCAECHRVGDEGDKIRGPNLGIGDDMTETVAARARAQRPDWAAAEYMVEAILDPDAIVVDGYAKGVMKRPDEPPIALSDDEVIALAVFLAGDGGTARDVDAARARIAPVRAARDQRRTQAWADNLIRRIRWDACDARRGEQLYRRLGCELCHDNPRHTELGAPTLRGVSARLSREDLARWVVAPPLTRMPSYADQLDETELGHLCEYIASR